ncbi:TetR-family transcriptional regulator [Candidatus Sulfotelmatobacter sp. SbA7]|nr:TetR-family transcriptional regulator [Candidatus Sulfotelmatobacter sp. SbA7]
MATLPATRASRRPRNVLPAIAATRFDRRLGEILDHATEVFCVKGYEGASMRDLSRATGMSLAGLYHYFQSKERLLFLIQKHTFTTIVEKLKARLEGVTDPEQRIRTFILNHLEYFVNNQEGLKVLSHEDDSLKNGQGSEIAGIKREYYRICLGLMEDLRRDRGLDFNTRTAVMSLFGMINWIYTWYNPRVDGNAEALAERMGNMVLNGIVHGGNKIRKKSAFDGQPLEGRPIPRNLRHR